MRSLFAVYVWIVWVLHLILGAPIAILATLISRTWGHAVLKAIVASAFGLAGIRMRVVGLERVDWSVGHVFMGNHQGYLDPFVLVSAIPAHMVGIEKQENFRIPFYGQLARAWGNLPIDRKNPQAARATIALAAERMAHGDSIAIFPEGTRSVTGEIAPFKKGGFHLALDAGASIVPFTLTGSYERLRPHTWRVAPGLVTIEFGEAIPTAGYDTEHLAPLIERVREAIASRYGGVEPAR
jgi:1-acyl-sn-glycerol-3-phosphate acyltransferase